MTLRCLSRLKKTCTPYRSHGAIHPVIRLQIHGGQHIEIRVRYTCSKTTDALRSGGDTLVVRLQTHGDWGKIHSVVILQTHGDQGEIHPVLRLQTHGGQGEIHPVVIILKAKKENLSPR